MTAISLLFKAIPPAMSLIAVATKKQNMEELKGLPLLIAKLYAKCGPVIATAILAALGLATGLGIAASMGAFNKEEDKEAANDINKLSNEIYKLNEKANAINTITENFDRLHNKLIKTNSDLKEMSSLLDQATDKLSTEVDKEHDFYNGKSEREYYESYGDDQEGRRQALEAIEENNRRIDENRRKQIQYINDLSTEERTKFLDDDTSDATILRAQRYVYEFNNNELYKYIDSKKDSGELTKEKAAAVESLTKKILEEMSVEEA